MNQNASGNKRVVLSTMVGKRLLALVDYILSLYTTRTREPVAR